MAPTHPVLSVEGRSVAWRDREFLRGESEPSGGRVRHSCPGVGDRRVLYRQPGRWDFVLEKTQTTGHKGALTTKGFRAPKASAEFNLFY